MNKMIKFLGKRNGTDKLSWYRIRCLLSMQTTGGRNVSKWILYPMMMAVFLGVALFFVWLDPPKEIFGNMIWLIYMMTSLNLLSFLNKDKSREIEFLVLPASTKEKIIAHLIQAISVPTMMLAITIPAIILVQGLVNLNAGQTFLSCMPVIEVLTVGNFILGLFLQSIFGFSVLAFRKWAMIKGLFIGLPVLCIVVSINALLTKSESNIKEILIFLFNGILLILTIFVWIANYYKLKKREI